MNESDLNGLPDITRRLVARLLDLGLDRLRIHGFFVLLGLYVGAPDTQERHDELYSLTNDILPLDRSKNIDEVIGHIYHGYDREINEFCFRSGADFDFRKIAVPKSSRTISIIYLRDEGLFQNPVGQVDKLMDASQLFDSFLQLLGRSTAQSNAGLLDAYMCGIFQIQLHSLADVSGSRQLARVIHQLMPICLGRCFNSVVWGDVAHLLGLIGEQVALAGLMAPLADNYARQMWRFQSHLFYYQQRRLEGLDDLSPSQWHAWVLDKACRLDFDYPTQLAAFSQSGVVLSGVPLWGSEIKMFETCDAYINQVWGYCGTTLTGAIERLEYRALMIHLIYSSLTQSREN